MNQTKEIMMLNPFDSEFLSQELREAWKRIEELEKENKELQAENLSLKMEKEQQNDLIKYLQDQVDFYEGQEELREWNREQYGDY